MKIECNKKQLMELVNNVTPITKTKSSFAILANVLIDATEKDVFIKATSMERSYTSKLDAKIVEVGSITVLQTKLLKVLKKIPDGDIVLESEAMNMLKINYSSGKSTNKSGCITMIGVGVVDYPEIPEYPEEKTIFNIEKSCFQRMIKKTIFSVSNDTSQYTLNGLLFELKDETFKIVGIDGRRLALCNTIISDIEDLSIVIPADAVQFVYKLLKNIKNVNIAFSENRVYFKLGYTVISSATLQGKFPNYNMFISKNFESEMTVNKKDLIDSLSITSEFSGEYHKIYFDLQKDKMILSANDADLGEFKDQIDIQYNGPDRKIGLTYTLLKDILNEIESDEIKFNFNPEISPIKITDSLINDYLYIIMPIKLD